MSQAKILATLKSVTCIKAKINSLFKYRLHSLAWNKFQFHIYTTERVCSDSMQMLSWILIPT